MLAEGNKKVLGINALSESPVYPTTVELLEEHEWYVDIIYYLKNLTCSSHLVNHKRRALRLKASKYCFVQNGLGWRSPNGPMD